MFEVLVEKIILSQLAGYIEGIDSNQLKISLWNGKIVLENVRLDPRLLIKLRLPLILKYTRIAKIDITVPWTSLSTKSVEISIQGIYCILNSYPKKEWSFNTDFLIGKIKDSLKNYELWWEFESEKKKLSEEAKGKSSSFFENLKVKILKNLRVNISSIHLRFEDQHKKNEYSMGLLIDSICSSPADDKTVFEVQHFSIYINICENHYKSIDEQIAKQFDNDWIISSKLYLVSASIIVTDEGSVKKMNANIKQLSFEYTHLQYICTIKFLRKFSKYQNFLAKELEHKKYLVYSPVTRSPRSLWKFAKDAILSIIRQKKHVENIFVMPAKTKFYYRSCFKELFKKLRKQKLNETEELLYAKILYLCEWNDLVEWEYEVLEICKIEQQEQENKKWFKMLSFSHSNVPEVIQIGYFKDMPAPEETKKISFEVLCSLIEFKLATYSANKSLIQCQHLQLINSKIEGMLLEDRKIINSSIEKLNLSYKDSASEKSMVSVNPSDESPGIMLNLVKYKEMKVPDEVVYRSQEVQASLDFVAISHFFNFISIKDLSTKNKKEVLDQLKHMQEKAMSQITDIFYYEKTYKISIAFPTTQLKVPAENGEFIISLYQMHILDSKNLEDSPSLSPNPLASHNSSFKIAVEIEVKYNELILIPTFQINFAINTLTKKILKLKWDCEDSTFDSYYDLEVQGEIKSIFINFQFEILKEIEYIKNHIEIKESKESLLLDKFSIMKGFEVMNSLTLSSSYLVKKCIGVVNNDTIYFFQNNEVQFAFDYFPVTGCIVEKNGCTIVVKTNKKSLSLGFAKESIAERWFFILVPKAGAVSAINKPKLLEKNLFRFSFVIGSMNLSLVSEGSLTHYKLSLKRQQFEVSYNHFEQIFTIQTFMIEAEDGESRPLLICGGQELNEKIMVKLCSKDSKNYQGTDVDIIVNLSHFNAFCDKSTLKHLISFFASLKKHSSSPSSSSSSPQKDLAVEFEFNILSFCINFSKLHKSRGKFSFQTLLGKLLYKDSGLSVKGFLQNGEFLWMDLESNSLIPLLVSDSEKTLDFEVGVKDDDNRLSVNLNDFRVLAILQVLNKMVKYFNGLAPEVQEVEESESRQGGAGVKLEIVAVNFEIRAKESYKNEESVELSLGKFGFYSNGQEIEVLIERANGNTSHQILNQEITAIRIKQNQIEIEGITLFFNLSDKDVQLLLALSKAAPAKKENTKVMPPVSQSPLNLALVFRNFTVQLSKNSDILQLAINEINVEVVKNQKITKIEVASLLQIAYNSKIIAENNSNSGFLFSALTKHSISRTNWQIKALELNYDPGLLAFYQEFCSNVYISESASNSKEKSVEKSEFILTIKKAAINLEYEHAKIKIICETSVKMIANPQSLHIMIKDFMIFKLEAQEENQLLEKCELEVNIKTEKNSTYDIFIKPLVLSINLSDVILFKNLYFALIPKKRSESHSTPKALLSSRYELYFSTIVINVLTACREPLLEFNAIYDDCRADSSQFMTFFCRVRLSANYFNPLLQNYESFIEPFNLLIQYQNEAISNFLSELQITTYDNQPLTISLTDSNIKHFSRLYSHDTPRFNVFSVCNNTGCPIVLCTSDKLKKEINDQGTELIPPLTETTVVSVIIKTGTENEPYLSKIPLFCQGAQKHQLDKTTEILTEIQIVDNKKQLKISSPLEIKNNTQIAIDLFFYAEETTQVIYSMKKIDPLCIVSVPLACLKGSISFVPPNTPPESCIKIKLKQIIELSPTCKSGNFVLLLDFSESVIYIRPTLELRNYLPTYISVECAGESFIITPSEKKDLYISANKAVKMVVTVNGFYPNDELVVFLKKVPKVLMVRNSNFALDIGCFTKTQPTYCVIFYPLVLLVNLSMLPLDFLVRIKNDFPCFSQGYTENRILCGNYEKIYVKIDNNISSSLEIDHALSSSFDIDAGKAKFQLVYSITTANIPNESKHTKVITFHSKFFFTNFMKQDIKIIQNSTPPANFTFIKSGKSSYYNWYDFDQDYYLSIWVEHLSKRWSGAFKIDKSTTFYLKVNNDIARMFIKVDVKEENGIVNVQFYNSNESDIKIINNSEETITFYQENYVVPEILSPGNEVYFAWHAQAFKQIMLIENDLNGERSIFELMLDDLETYEMSIGKNQEKIILLKVKKEANTTVLEITENFHVKEQTKIASLCLRIGFPAIFLSLIQSNIYMKKEVLLLTFNSLSAALYNFDDHMEWILSLEDFQIDSQIYEYVACPIFLATEGESPIEFSGKFVSSEKWYCLDDMKVKLKNFIINADNNVIESIVGFHKQFNTAGSFDLDYYLSASCQSQSPSTQPYIYLAKLSIDQFSISFSYKSLPSKVKDHFKSFFINFDNMIIFFEESRYSRIYGSPVSLSLIISNNYKEMVLKNLDGILKQHGMIGGALLFGLKLSNKLSRLNESKLSKLHMKSSRESTKYYNSMVNEQKAKQTVKFTRIARDTGSIDSFNQKRENKKVNAFMDVLNNPINGLATLFTSKKKEKNDAQEVLKYKQKPTRVFYGKLGLIKQFNADDSMAAGFFREKKAKYANYAFYGQSIGTEKSKNNKQMLVAFDKKIALIDLSLTKILWKINPVLLEPIQMTEKGLRFRGMTKKFKQFEHFLKFLETDSMDTARKIVFMVLQDISN